MLGALTFESAARLVEYATGATASSVAPARTASCGASAAAARNTVETAACEAARAPQVRIARGTVDAGTAESASGDGASVRPMFC